MSAHIQATITALEQELDAIDQRRGALVNAIGVLRPLAGDVTPSPKPKKAPAVGRKAVERRTLADVVKVTKTPASARPRLDIVPARDAAITSALKRGPMAVSALLEIMPREPGQTPGQRDSALSNALTRLRLKKVIRSVDEGWALV